MKKQQFFILIIVCTFLLTACAQGVDVKDKPDPPMFEPDTTSIAAPVSEEILPQITDWQDKLVVTAKQVQGNALGYSLFRTAGEISYVRDADYLIEENAVGNGIFISEHMSETEAFLGHILIEALNNRGEIAEENKPYFTDWAIQQLIGTNWQLFDKDWTPDWYAYDRFYTLSSLWGGVGYVFTYTIYADNMAATSTETQAAKIKCAVAPDGIISGISVDIYSVDREHSGVLYTENTTGLFCDEHQEPVVEAGIELAYGDTVKTAQQLGAFAIAALENKGGDVAEDKNMFANETAFQSFWNNQWEQLEDNWRANRFYNCYCTDKGYLYYIYPDYEKMGVETAKAVMLWFDTDNKSGRLTDTALLTVSMTKEQYQAAREYLGERSVVVKNGELQGNGNGFIPVPTEAFMPMLLKEYMFENKVPNILEKVRESRIFADEELQPYLLGKRLWKELEEDSETLGITGAGEGWQLKEGYDAYYYPHNQRAGSIHYCYYFTFTEEGEHQEREQEKVLRIDTWVSQNDVAAVEHSWFLRRNGEAAIQRAFEAVVEHSWSFGDLPQKETAPAAIQEDVSDTDITAFLAFDWTADSVLWEHALQPADSAQGWEFSVADIDFDGILEMLVTFPANHCGQNCVYIYQQKTGQVSSLADTIAVFEKYIRFGTDYKKLSPYLDIELLDAYVDENGVYRYLSLDNSSFGGDSKGGIYTLSLYETVLEQGTEPKELVRIEENWQEEQRKMYFLDERVYELGALRELLATYMDGYTKWEICYQTAVEMFPRDIVAWSTAQKRQALEILYDALLTVLNGPYPAKTAISSAIDYTMLEAEGYEILNENICVDPKPVSEDSWLAEQLKDIIGTFDKDRNNIADYFRFDLNNDGIEEYVVSVYASGWVGSAGNYVVILNRKEDGSSDRIFEVTTPLYLHEGEYNPLAVLQETAGGYYKIVLPYSVMIWQYDVEKEKYDIVRRYRP